MGMVAPRWWRRCSTRSRIPTAFGPSRPPGASGLVVTPRGSQVMQEVGIDFLPALPRQLSGPLASGAQHLVTMGCAEDHPFFAGVRVEDWTVEDPRGKSIGRVRQIRDAICRRVEK